MVDTVFAATKSIDPFDLPSQPLFLEPYVTLLGRVNFTDGIQEVILPGQQKPTWCVVGFEKAQSVLEDHRNFQSARLIPQPSGEEGPETKIRQKKTSSLRNYSDHVLIFLDGGTHGDNRRLFYPPLRSTEIDRLGDIIESSTQRSIAELPGRGERFDLNEAYFQRVTVSVISEILGIPADKDELYSRLSIASFRGTDLVGSRNLFRLGNRAIEEWLSDLDTLLFEEDRVDQNSVAGSYCRQGIEMGISREEIVMGLSFLYLAGHSTTSSALASLVRFALEDDELRSRIVEDSIDWKSLISEVTRMHPPAQAIQRTVVNPEAFWAPVKAGDHIQVSLGAACRDPTKFSNPDQFDPDRFKNSKFTLSFGTGVHRCLGIFLAPEVIKRGAKKLLKERPSIRFVEGLRPTYAPYLTVLDYDSFPVES